MVEGSPVPRVVQSSVYFPPLLNMSFSSQRGKEKMISLAQG